MNNNFSHKVLYYCVLAYTKVKRDLSLLSHCVTSFVTSLILKAFILNIQNVTTFTTFTKKSQLRHNYVTRY
jgi:hypothetical protein